MTVGMIHQPHFLPWPGYVARCIAADTVVLLDNVRFKKGYYHNRTRYVTLGGREVWLTLPLAGHSTSGLLADAQVAPEFGVLRWQRRLVEAYRRCDAYDRVWPEISGLIDRLRPDLVAINVSTLQIILDILCEALGRVSPRLVLASAMNLSSNRTGRLVDIAEQQGITHLLMGVDALKAHDLESLKESGISLLRHLHRAGLSEAGDPARRPRPRAGVTTLHYMFDDGIAATAEALAADWTAVPVSSPTMKGHETPC